MLRLPLASSIAIAAGLALSAAFARGVRTEPAAPDELAGVWEAHPAHDGETSRVVLHIEKRADGKLIAKWSTPVIHFWEYPIGIVTVEGDDVHAGPLPLKYDRAAGTLAGVLPKAFVPVYSIPLTFKKTDSLDRDPRPALSAPSVSPVWTVDVGAPIWPDVSVCGAFVIAGDDAGRLHAIGAASGTRAWSLTTGGAIRARPTCADADVYVQSDDGYLYKVNAATGKQSWRVEVGKPVTRLSLGDPKSRYDYRASSAAVAGGRVYIGTDQGMLRALDARTGARLWEFAAGDAIFSSPTVADGRVYFGSFDGYIYALDATSGTLAWKHDTGGAVTSTPAIFGRAVIAGSRSYDLTAVDAANGVTLWKRYYWFSWVESSPAIFEKSLYIGSSDAAKAYAFDPQDGRQLWGVDVGGEAWGQPAVTDARVFVTTSGTVNYIVPHRAALLALDRRTGHVDWQFPLPPAPAVASSSDSLTYGFTGAPALLGAMVYAGALDGRVYAFHQ